LKWPFSIEKLALLYPKNIAVIAGSKDAGKTAIALNLAYMNRHKKVRYLSSEMGGAELKNRLKKFDAPLKDWKAIDFRERSSGFADVILPDGLTIIDFFEVTSEFWKIAEDFRRIYDKLTTGVCVVCLQKSENKDMGRGADFGLEKQRIYLTVDADQPAGTVIKIFRAKNYTQEDVNPRGLKKHFNVVQGAHLIEAGNWYRG
jgi:hypothetical protein